MTDWEKAKNPQPAENVNTNDKKPEGPKSEEWYTEALEELDEFIESQGIYIRQ